MVLQSLSRLTQDEARTTAAQTLEVVHGLLQSISVVIEGELCPQLVIRYLLHTSPPDGKASIDGIRKVPGMFYFGRRASSVSDWRQKLYLKWGAK